MCREGNSCDRLLKCNWVRSDFSKCYFHFIVAVRISKIKHQLTAKYSIPKYVCRYTRSESGTCMTKGLPARYWIPAKLSSFLACKSLLPSILIFQYLRQMSSWSSRQLCKYATHVHSQSWLFWGDILLEKVEFDHIIREYSTETES